LTAFNFWFQFQLAPLQLGYHVSEQGAAWAYGNFSADGVVPLPQPTSSQFTGVSWSKNSGKWQASCKGVYFGNHATEEAAARAYDNYVTNGVDPVRHRGGTTSTSHFKGVCRDECRMKWQSACKGKYLGHHPTEEAAAQAVDNYAKNGVILVRHREDPTSQFKVGRCRLTL
jgi:hypothetical protein